MFDTPEPIAMEDTRSSNQLCYLFTFHTRLVIYGNISVVVGGNLSVMPSANSELRIARAHEAEPLRG